MSHINPSETGGLQGAILRAARAANDQLKADMAVVRRILTPAYTVQESKEPNAIRCTSRTGMDDANDAAWGPVMTALRQHFGARLLEVSANVCYRHTDFTIFLGHATGPVPVPVRTFVFQYGVVHYRKAELVNTTDEQVAEEYRLHGPLKEAYDDQMSQEEFDSLEDAHEQ